MPKKSKSKKNVTSVEVQKRSHSSKLRGESTREIKGFSRKIKIREIHPEEFESNLEEEVKEGPEFNTEQFHEFINPSIETETPVLKPIERFQEATNLEQNIEAFSSQPEKKQNDAIQYKTISENYEAVAAQSRKIIDEELVIHQPLKTARLEEQRIHFHEMPEQSFQINPELHELRRQSEGRLEKDYVTKIRGDFKEKTQTHSPFEKQDKKYEIK